MRAEKSGARENKAKEKQMSATPRKLPPPKLLKEWAREGAERIVATEQRGRPSSGIAAVSLSVDAAGFDSMECLVELRGVKYNPRHRASEPEEGRKFQVIVTVEGNVVVATLSSYFRLAGRATSERKASMARINGARGGRPRHDGKPPQRKAD